MGLAWLADDAVALSSHLGAIHRHQKRQNQIMSCCFFFLISCYFQNFNGISPVSWVSSYHHFLCLGNCCCWIVNRCGDFLGISMYWECLLGSNIWNKIFIAIPNPSMKFEVLWIWYPLIVQHASGPVENPPLIDDCGIQTSIFFGVFRSFDCQGAKGFPPNAKCQTIPGTPMKGE